MPALGDSGIDRFNDLDELLGGGPQEKELPFHEEVDETTEEPVTTEKKNIPKDEKLKHQRSVKLTDTEDEWISMLMVAMGTKNTGEAIRYCVRKVHEEYGEEIQKIAKKKEKISALLKSI